MPTYEYHCRQCGHELEVMQRMTDAKLTTCPNCNEEALEKRISAVNFSLKGTGWYETDFKNSGKPAAKGADDGAGEKAKKADSSDNTKSAKDDTKSTSSTTKDSSSGTKAGSSPGAD